MKKKKTYLVEARVYIRGEMGRRPIEDVWEIEAESAKEAREKALGMGYSSLSDVVRLGRVRAKSDNDNE